MLNTTLIPAQSSLIIALSGGPDSVYLAHTLKTIAAEKELTLTAAHLDHQWREDSHKDMLFCRALCEQLDIPFITAQINDLNVQFKDSGSKEDLGRRYRRFFLEKARQEKGADFIALGHHADDQRETFFIRLLRGSSLTGLTGMKEVDGYFIRPALHLTKEEILEYLKQHTIAYLHDPTNDSDAFLRNRIRAELIPAFKKCDNRFTTTFENTFKRLQQAEDFLQEMTKKTLAEIAPEKDLLVSEFLALHQELQYRVLMAWLCQQGVNFPVSQGFLDEIIRFAKEGRQSSHTLMNSWKLVRDKERLFLFR